MASAICSTFPGSTTMPLNLSVTRSVMPPTAVVITGIPWPIASRIDIPNDSK